MHPRTLGYYESIVNVMATQPTPCKTYSPMVSLNAASPWKNLVSEGGTVREGWLIHRELQRIRFSKALTFPKRPDGTKLCKALEPTWHSSRPKCCHFLKLENPVVNLICSRLPSASLFWSGLEPKHWASQGIWSTGGSQQSSYFSISILEHPEIWS